MFDALSVNQFCERVAEKKRTPAIVEAELELIQVGIQMLCTDSMKGPDYPALE